MAYAVEKNQIPMALEYGLGRNFPLRMRVNIWQKFKALKCQNPFPTWLCVVCKSDPFFCKSLQECIWCIWSLQPLPISIAQPQWYRTIRWKKKSCFSGKCTLFAQNYRANYMWKTLECLHFHEKRASKRDVSNLTSQPKYSLNFTLLLAYVAPKSNYQKFRLQYRK